LGKLGIFPKGFPGFVGLSKKEVLNPGVFKDLLGKRGVLFLGGLNPS